MLVTGGLLEAHSDGPPFDEAGLARVGGLAAALEDAVLLHTGGSAANDMAAVVLRQSTRTLAWAWRTRP